MGNNQPLTKDQAIAEQRKDFNNAAKTRHGANMKLLIRHNPSVTRWCECPEPQISAVNGQPVEFLFTVYDGT